MNDVEIYHNGNIDEPFVNAADIWLLRIYNIKIQYKTYYKF